jgi:hypothetical protein
MANGDAGTGPRRRLSTSTRPGRPWLTAAMALRFCLGAREAAWARLGNAGIAPRHSPGGHCSTTFTVDLPVTATSRESRRSPDSADKA